MNKTEAKEVAELIAPIVADAVANKLSEASTAKVEEHEKVLRGKNGDIGLIGRVFNLETNQKRIIGIFSAIGAAVLLDIVARIWSLLVNIPLQIP